MIDTESMIRLYGDQAYHKAIQFTVIAANLGDMDAGRQCAEVARELMKRGFHKHPKREEP
jgi:hypothetical protein